MPNLKRTPKAGNGLVCDVTPANANWKYVGFQLHRLAPGETASGLSKSDETCLVYITGKGTAFAGSDLGELGEIGRAHV